MLLIFAASHFAFLTLNDYSQSLDNVVFPAFTNKTVYMLAGFLEMSVGILCLKFSGKIGTNTIILTFVGVILSYRWAFFSMGGVLCNCLGALGRLYHLSKTQEKILPFICLLFLISTTMPWLYQNFKRMIKHRILLSLLLLFLGLQGIHSETVVVQGTYEDVRYNPRKLTIYTNLTIEAAFTAIISEDGWKILATNLNDKASWSEIIYDGTNTYTLTPYGDHFLEPPGESNLVFCTVSPGSIYVCPVADEVKISIPWFTYGLSPSTVTPVKTNKFVLPLPGTIGRSYPTGYDYNWLMESSADGRFLKNCQVVRDYSLDLDEKQELLRPELNYPHSLAELSKIRSEIAWEKKEVPDGFLITRYECTEWRATNNLLIPVKSEMESYQAAYPDSPQAKARLEADSVTLCPDGQRLVSSPDAPTLVNDYRYKKVKGHRMFEFAEYTLRPGDDWKPDNDPAILAQVDYQLKYGRRYDDFNKGRTLIWLLMVLIVLTPVVIWLFNKKRK